MKLKVNRKTLDKMINNNEDVSNIDTSSITDMSWLFDGYKDLDNLTKKVIEVMERDKIANWIEKNMQKNLSKNKVI